MAGARNRKKWVQLGLESARKPTGRGGWRPGAGRPKGRRTTPHDARPELSGRHPLHVTWRTGPHAPGLRSYYPERFIREAIAATRRESFGVVEYSIQGNHLHMLVEARSKKALEVGMRSLARRIVPKMRTKFAWKGKLFTRYHARELRTPREVRNALRYVLLNARHHMAGAEEDRIRDWVDPYSSGYWFEGWHRSIVMNRDLAKVATIARPTAKARTWLLSVGWRRWGLLDFDDVP
jgi:REP element-mobilizing transposase RayT